MTGNEFQKLAARTMKLCLNYDQTMMHGLHGLASEVGEIHGLFQKVYQGHDMDDDELKKEIGDLLWFIAEICTVNAWNIEDIMQMNVDKLMKRYPDGFEAVRSVNREEYRGNN